MIQVYRKPASKIWSHFDEDVAELCDSPRQATTKQNKKPISGTVEIGFQTGNSRGSDCAIHIEWSDIVEMIEFLAKQKYPPAVALAALRRLAA